MRISLRACVNGHRYKQIAEARHRDDAEALSGQFPTKINGLKAVISEGLRKPQVVERLSALGSTPLSSKPAEFLALMHTRWQNWQALVRSAFRQPQDGRASRACAPDGAGQRLLIRPHHHRIAATHPGDVDLIIQRHHRLVRQRHHRRLAQ